MRRIALFGLVLFVASVAVATAASGGLPNIGNPSMQAQPSTAATTTITSTPT